MYGVRPSAYAWPSAYACMHVCDISTPGTGSRPRHCGCSIPSWSELRGERDSDELIRSEDAVWMLQRRHRLLINLWCMHS